MNLQFYNLRYCMDIKCFAVYALIGNKNLKHCNGFFFCFYFILWCKFTEKCMFKGEYSIPKIRKQVQCITNDILVKLLYKTVSLSLGGGGRWGILKILSEHAVPASCKLRREDSCSSRSTGCGWTAAAL